MSIADDWASKIAEFRDLMTELDGAESALYASYDTAVELNEKYLWEEHFREMNAYKSTLQAALDLIDSVRGVWDTVSGAFGVFGMSGVRGLGVWQIGIPLTIAGAAALIAAGVVLVNKIYATIAQWNERRVVRLVASGVDPKEADIQVYGAAGKPVVTAISDSIMWIALAVAAVFVIPPLLKRK